MMPLPAYAAVSVLLLWLAHRCVRRLSVRAALLVAIIPLAFCGYALLTNRAYAPLDLPYQTPPLTALQEQHGIRPVSSGMHTDVWTEFIPWRESTRWSLARGEWGLWNPFAMSGEVLMASAQTAVYSPLTLIACTMPVGLSFTFTAAITFFIAALTAFLLARELGCSEPSSLVAAAGWAFCTPITLFLLVTMGQVWVWCPLLLLAVRRVVEQPTLRAASLLTFAFTAILYAGHPESAVLCVFVGLLYGIFELVRVRNGVVRPALVAAAAGVVALLLSAIHLLPFLDALRQSVEYTLREYDFVDAQPDTPWRWTIARMAMNVLPYLHERPWNVENWHPRMSNLEMGVVGSVVLALAIYGAIATRTSTTKFLAGLGVFSLLVNGEWAPLVSILRRIPLLELSLTSRLSYSFAMCACILAAIGVEHAFGKDVQRRKAAITLAATLIVLAIANFWVTRTPLVSHVQLQFGDYKVAAELAGLALAVVVILKAPRLAPALLLAIVIAQRVASDGGLYHSFEQRQAYAPVPMFDAIPRGGEPFRVVGHRDTLIPQTATMYQLEDVRGVPSLQLKRYAETYALWCTPQPVWFQRVDDLTRPFLSFLNVRYAVSRAPAPPGWREVARDATGTYLHENLGVMGRAFVPRSVSVGYPRLWNLSDILSESDFEARAWIEGPLQPQVRENGPGTITGIRTSRLGYSFIADMQNDGWVVTSIPAWNGWRAVLDGQEAPARIANHAFVGVHVPKGRHTVRLVYWPASFAWGSAITIATLVALALMAVILRRRPGEE